MQRGPSCAQFIKVNMEGNEVSFISASRWEGAKQGFYFSKGPEGLGYYKDINGGSSSNKRAAEKASTSAGKPPAAIKPATILKNNPIIKKIEKKPSNGSLAKKADGGAQCMASASRLLLHTHRGGPATLFHALPRTGPKSAYLQAMEQYRAQSCDTTAADRPLVK